MLLVSKLLKKAGPIRVPVEDVKRIARALIRTYQSEAQDPEYLLKGAEVHNSFGVKSPWVNGAGKEVLGRYGQIDITSVFINGKAPASRNPRAFIQGAGARFWGDDIRVRIHLFGIPLLRWETHWINDPEMNDSTMILQFREELESVLTHEFAHILDPNLDSTRVKKTLDKVDQTKYRSDDTTYHNNLPMEVKAYLAQCSREMRNYMEEYYWEGDTFEETLSRGVPHWTRQLAQTLSPDNRKIILKELGKIWTEFQGKGKG